ncbi:MAG: DUF2243 domain-containing protein [Comamonadaceae bacterium]|nr:DUF2243 domain-containing protein [Comamonadaceae bacterium]
MAASVSRPTQPGAYSSTSALRLPGLLMGVAFGGFFDGIVLHQILQWHHLLSGLSGGRWADLRVQLLADGLFHALMYVLAAIGLVLLVRRRHSLSVPGARDTLLVMFITGFALWHLLDAVLSHWLLGIHRIRMDSTQPLAWDIGWLLVFGLLPWLWARHHARKAPAKGPSTGGGGTLAVLVCTTALAGAIAARTPPDAPTVVLLQNATQAGALLASLPPETRIVGSDASGTVWLFAGKPPPSQSGAWKLTGTGLPAGCSAWTRV